MSYETITYYNGELYGIADIESSVAQLEKRITYLSEAEHQALVSACFYAAEAHKADKRESGEPYICHPIKVAEILASEVQVDLPVLLAAVLHDVIEDTDIGKAEIAKVFSDEVANLVDGVTKLKKSKDVSREKRQADTFAKLANAMEADPRVVMIKFADRLHNMQTLMALPAESRHRIAQETLDIYVPIAGRLGMFTFKEEMENLAFKHLHPWRYDIIERWALAAHPERQAIYSAFNENVSQYLSEVGIENVSIRKRRRNLFDIHRRMTKTRRRRLNNASIPVVILTETADDCYRMLGIIHKLYKPVVNKLADYIGSAKANGYQSLHTAVVTEDRHVLTIQIRTRYMHNVAESGIIAIWRQHYIDKSGRTDSEPQRDKAIRRWLKNIKYLSSIADNSLEFYEAVKRDLRKAKIHVFTPKGEPIELPQNATVIDFAYAIHTKLGNHLKYAEVNGIRVKRNYRLSNGQTVELFTRPSVFPSSVWIKHAETARARTAIRHYLRELPKEKLPELGREEIRRYLAKRNICYHNLDKLLKKVAKNRDISLEKLLRSIALREVERRIIHAELQEVVDSTGVTTILHVKMHNRSGALAMVAETIGNHGINILRIEFPEDMRAKQVTMLFELHVHDITLLTPLVGNLCKQPLVKSIKTEEITS